MREIDRRIIGELCRQRRLAREIRQSQIGSQPRLSRFERGEFDSLAELDLVLSTLEWPLPTVLRLVSRVHDIAQTTWTSIQPSALFDDWAVGARRVAGEVGLVGYITWHVAVVLRVASELTDE